MEKVVKEARTIAGFADVPLYFESEEEIKRSDMEEAREKFLQEGREKGLKEGMKQGLKEGIEQGIKEGLEEGTMQKQNEMVINMYNNNLSLELIRDISGLSITEINNILKNNM